MDLLLGEVRTCFLLHHVLHNDEEFRASSPRVHLCTAIGEWTTQPGPRETGLPPTLEPQEFSIRFLFPVKFLRCFSDSCCSVFAASLPCWPIHLYFDRHLLQTADIYHQPNGMRLPAQSLNGYKRKNRCKLTKNIHHFGDLHSFNWGTKAKKKKEQEDEAAEEEYEKEEEADDKGEDTAEEEDEKEEEAGDKGEDTAEEEEEKWKKKQATKVKTQQKKRKKNGRRSRRRRGHNHV